MTENPIPSRWFARGTVLTTAALLLLACGSLSSSPMPKNDVVGGSIATGGQGLPSGGAFLGTVRSSTDSTVSDGTGGQGNGGTAATMHATDPNVFIAGGTSSGYAASGGAGETEGDASGGAAPSIGTNGAGGNVIDDGKASGGNGATGGSQGVAGAASGGTTFVASMNAIGGATSASGGATSASGGATSASGGTQSVGGASETGPNSGGQTGNGHGVPVFVRGPTLVPNDKDSAPLAATLLVETDVSTTGTVHISGGGESWTLSLDDTPTHERPLLGFKPDTDYVFTITVAANGIDAWATPLRWHTPALPADFPKLAFVQSDPTRMAAGMTMFDVILKGYLVVVDSTGDVRWYYRAPRINHRYRLRADGGSILCVSGGPYLTEVDWFGNTVSSWYAANSGRPPVGTIPVAVDNFHHSVEEMPTGNLLVLSQERRVTNNYPTSSYDPTAVLSDAWVTGDQVVEITKRGEVVKRYSLFDTIDPTRIGHDSVDRNDWTHSNAVIYDSRSDAYLVSMRHQDAVIKMRRETGELVWILGNHANWREPWRSKLLTPLGSNFEWQYHQHAIELTPSGIGLYDNGNYRVPAYQEPTPPFFSRVVRYAIDEETMTVEQVWEYHPHFAGIRLFSYAMSDADVLKNGNILITSGTLTSQRAQPGWAHIVEITDGAESVFELLVVNSIPDNTVYDADRIPDIRYMNAAQSCRPE